MWPLFVTLVFGYFVIIPCWKAFMSALLLEKDEEKWAKWQQSECERIKRRDARLAQCINGFLWVVGWLERKLLKPRDEEPLPHLPELPNPAMPDPAPTEVNQVH
jgi:hypothetical protein